MANVHGGSPRLFSRVLGRKRYGGDVLPAELATLPCAGICLYSLSEDVQCPVLECGISSLGYEQRIFPQNVQWHPHQNLFKPYFLRAVMLKRGQLSESAVHYLIVMVCVAVILGIGYYSFSSVQNRLCKTESSKFQLDVKGIDREVGDGSLIEKEFSIPCDADEVYFVDTKKAKPEYFANPLIKDVIESKTEKNVFVVKDGKIESSFNAGDLQMAYPGYSCMVPRSGKVDTFAEGKRGGVDIIPGCYQVECTDIPEEVSPTDAKDILGEFLKFYNENPGSCAACPIDLQSIDTLLDELNIQQVAKNLNIYRRYTYCPDTGITKVEIIIKPQEGKVVKNFRYYETIPKDCVDDLNTYLETLTIDGEVYVKGDPLLMWQFDEIDGEKTIEYTLKGFSQADCLEKIQGLGLGEKVQEVNMPDADPPTIDILPDQLLTLNEGETTLFSLNNYVSDDKTPRDQISWEIQGNPNKVIVKVMDTAPKPSSSSPIVINADVVADVTPTQPKIGTLADIEATHSNTHYKSILSIQPKLDVDGEEEIILRAYDSTGKYNEQTFTVKIVDAIPLDPIPDITLIGATLATIDLATYANLEGKFYTTTILQTDPNAASCKVEEDQHTIKCDPGSSENSESEIEVEILDTTTHLKNYVSFKVHRVTSAEDFYEYTCKIKKHEECITHPLGDDVDICPSGMSSEKKGCCGGPLGKTACTLSGGLLGKVKYHCFQDEKNLCQASTSSNPCEGNSAKKLKKKDRCTPSCSPTGTKRGDCVSSALPSYANYAGYRCESPTPTTVQLKPKCGSGPDECGCPSPKECTTGKTCETRPIISDPSVPPFTEGISNSFALSVTDSDGAPITVAAYYLPTGAVFDSSSNTFSWTPSYIQEGPYSVTFTATDSTGLSSSKTVAISVANTLQACGATPHGSCSGVYYCNDGAMSSTCSNNCCVSPNTCGGGTDPNTCGCTPSTSCAAQGKNCGTVDTGCGTENCGTCSSGQTCPSGQCVSTCTSECTTLWQKQCANNFEYRECKELSSGCYRWDPPTSSSPKPCSDIGLTNCISDSCCTCPSGKTCGTGTQACTPLVASLSMNFESISPSFDGSEYHYPHTRAIRENNGIGVTLTTGKLCSTSRGCVSGTVAYSVTGGSVHTFSGNFDTDVVSDTFSLIYEGSDSNGNPISVSKTLTVSGLSYS